MTKSALRDLKDPNPPPLRASPDAQAGFSILSRSGKLAHASALLSPSRHRSFFGRPICASHGLD